MTVFSNLHSSEGLQVLDQHLTEKSYISGYVASRDDLKVFQSILSAPEAKQHPHANRWWKHINALIHMSFPGESQGVTVEGSGVVPVPVPIPIITTIVEETIIVADDPAEVEEEEEDDMGKDVMVDDDEDLDLFGEQTEEEKKAQEEKNKIIQSKLKKSAEKSKLSKSMIIMDVKPWDDTTDLGELEKYVRDIKHDGLLWGSSKLVPVGFGIRKLQITAVIEDVKIESMDIIIEDEIVKDGENPHIQSVDIVAFNKL